jgi:hypothetical protein
MVEASGGTARSVCRHPVNIATPEYAAGMVGTNSYTHPRQGSNARHRNLSPIETIGQKWAHRITSCLPTIQYQLMNSSRFRSRLFTSYCNYFVLNPMPLSFLIKFSVGKFGARAGYSL